MGTKEKLINTKITLSKYSRSVVHIDIVDCTSGITFVSTELDLVNFAEMLTGLARVEATSIVRDLEYVGKKKITEKRSLIYSNKLADRDEIKSFLIEKYQGDGWILDTYLGSQGSIVQVDDGVIVNYSVYKYVEA